MVAGAVHFVSLRWNTLYFAGGHPAIAFAIQVARLVLTAAILFLLARAGAFALLAGTGGFIWTRSIALDLGRVRS
jgi:F1F0 ATPase subunit 2